jgi:hypothetical protein
MDIKGTGRIDRSRTAHKAKAGAQADGAFSLPSDADAPRAASVSGPGPIAALDSLLALQGVGDATSGRSKGLARGSQLLDMLDEVRDGLLSGTMPRATLSRLAHAVSQREDHFADPGLQSVLDEIELRARVELAKLEVADRAAA